MAVRKWYQIAAKAIVWVAVLTFVIFLIVLLQKPTSSSPSVENSEVVSLQSDISLSNFDVLQKFPLEVGVTWVYSVTFVTGNLSESYGFEWITNSGFVTETIVDWYRADGALIFTSTVCGMLTQTTGILVENKHIIIDTAPEPYSYEMIR